ncbi:MAG: adenylate/guanylate cyclase domain-containing protein, partial [Leptospiraceae bacterium]|nr:adenylate/guanylate cyclase domain-containing protein [Leptospiraceae bacterium]
FFVIFFDYMYIVLSFLFDPALTSEESVIKWYAFAGAVVFFLINLLRYSKAGTIYAGFLSIIVFWGISFYYNTAAVDVFSMSIALAIILFIGYSITTSNKLMMVEANTKKMMERYLPPQLIGELYKKNVSLEPGGKNQKVTILFSDIRSFTTISESMTAAEVVCFLNEYLSEMTDIIFTQQGTIDKFMGDAIMTIFGAPLQSNDDALRAVKTAILMNKALVGFNKKHTQLKKNIEIGIGIHTGEVIVGNIGSDKRLDYTVIGDNVNLSSRIEGLTLHYSCPILISEATFEELSKESIEDSFCLREVDNVIVKGKLNFVKIYEVMFFDTDGEKDIVLRKKEEFEKGLQLYRSLKFREAIKQFENLKNDKLSKLYIERCRNFIQNPPDEFWDGTYTMKTK